MSALPRFRYHPDPIATGSVAVSDETCECCKQKRGFTYRASAYAINPPEYLCPWCIADGSAAKKFECTFADDHPLGDLADDIIETVTTRTPGYVSWQQEVWLTCCDDACAFHGDASKAELNALDEDEIEETLEDWEMDQRFWRRLMQVYEPGGDYAVYKFVCLHCDSTRYGLDMS